MRFLADESCDFSVVRALRSAGHDVVAVSEFQQRSFDEDVMATAHKEARVLLTEDKDFGWLAFVTHAESAGVVLIRYPAGARRTLASSVIRLVTEYGSELEGSFVTLRPGSVRISRPPAAGSL
jgi:predicted nuclease of predicted toxin-antitoxin system